MGVWNIGKGVVNDGGTVTVRGVVVSGDLDEATAKRAAAIEKSARASGAVENTGIKNLGGTVTVNGVEY